MIGDGLSVELGEFDVNWEAMHNIVNTLPSGGKLRMSQFADSEWFYWFYNNADNRPALAYDSFSTKVPFSGYSPNFKTVEWELDGSKIVDGMALADRTYYLTENRNLYSALSTEEPV